MDIENFDLEKTFSVLRGNIKPFLGQFISMPLATFAGLKVCAVEATECRVTLPGGWRTQNPFKSTYWAAQGMAAEMAAGVIPYAYVQAADVPIRMILSGTSGRFVKMCKTKSIFTCEVGALVESAMRETLSTGRSVTCDLSCIGRDESGDVISEWTFEWNFRARLETLNQDV